MGNTRERILIVENDPVISDLIGRQALQAAGYQTQVVGDVSQAINKTLSFTPDVIIANITLPGLSAKDLMVALNSQGVETPVIVLSVGGSDEKILQSFRLGASDFIAWPVREAEVINTVERVLKQVRERREKERLSRQLQQINQELQQRVRELTAIFTVGKAVTSITDQASLFNKILETACNVAQADMGWFLLREETGKNYLLVAHRNLPQSLSMQLNQVWDDGISSLVAMSGETLSIYGEPIKRFKIATLGQSALIVPIKVQRQVIGLLIVVRRQPEPFKASEQTLLEAVADYSSISLVNARLFRAVEDRARALQTQADRSQGGEKVTLALLDEVKDVLQQQLVHVREDFDTVAKDPTVRWTDRQQSALTRLSSQLETLDWIAASVNPLETPVENQPKGSIDLWVLVRKAVKRFQPFARQNRINLVLDFSEKSLNIHTDGIQIACAIDGLISNAIKFSPPGGDVILKGMRDEGRMAHLVVTDSGPGISAKQLPNIFKSAGKEKATAKTFGGLGVGLPLVHEIIVNQGGKIWVESKPGEGSSFHVALPIIESETSAGRP